jgi:hypothetical protein
MALPSTGLAVLEKLRVSLQSLPEFVGCIS